MLLEKLKRKRNWLKLQHQHHNKSIMRFYGPEMRDILFIEIFSLHTFKCSVSFGFEIVHFVTLQLCMQLNNCVPLKVYKCQQISKKNTNKKAEKYFCQCEHTAHENNETVYLVVESKWYSSALKWNKRISNWVRKKKFR